MTTTTTTTTIRFNAALAALTWVLAAAPVLAQSTLAELRAEFDSERDKLRQQNDGRLDFEKVRELAERHAKRLRGWLAEKARGADKVNGLLLLTNIYMDIGREDDARRELAGIDTAAAPAVELAAAAQMAGFLGMTEQRATWIDLAIAKDAPFEERMALALFLMTRLTEIDKGEAIFTAAAEQAEDDAARAHVAWYRCVAIREREDLPDGSYEKALEALAETFGDTRWGGIARDRLRALQMEIGDVAIPLAGKTLAGDDIALADYAGKVVLLDFWASWAERDDHSAQALATLRTEFGEKGFVLLGVALDDDREVAQGAVRESGRTWPQVWDGAGWQSEAALRYAVEQVPYQLLIGRDGKVAAMRIYLQDEAGVAELRSEVERALGDR